MKERMNSKLLRTIRVKKSLNIKVKAQPPKAWSKVEKFLSMIKSKFRLTPLGNPEEVKVLDGSKLTRERKKKSRK